MSWFKRKSKEEEEAEAEKKWQKARLERDKAIRENREKQALREVKEETKELKRQKRDFKYPRVWAAKEAVVEGTEQAAVTTYRGGKRFVGGAGKTGKEMITTVLTSRKLGPEGQAGVGRKYRKPKTVYIRPKYRNPEGPSPQTFGRGHTNPNLYGFKEYPQQVNDDGSRDLFAGNQYNVNRELFASRQSGPVELVNSRREDVSFRDTNDASTNLMGNNKQTDLFGSGDKKNLDMFASKMKKQRLF